MPSDDALNARKIYWFTLAIDYEVPNLPRFDRIFAVLSVSAAALFALCAVSAIRDLTAYTPDLGAETLPSDRQASYYIAVGSGAATEGNWPLAIAAAQLEIEASPDSAEAWNRLTFAETAAAGRPSGASLSALLGGYDAAPFPEPADMKWRIEYAAEHWAFMPDLVQDAVLGDIAILARMPQTQGARYDWCEMFRARALKDAACASLIQE